MKGPSWQLDEASNHPLVNTLADDTHPLVNTLADVTYPLVNTLEDPLDEPAIDNIGCCAAERGETNGLRSLPNDENLLFRFYKCKQAAHYTLVTVLCR